MVMLTDVLGFSVTDKSGGRARVSDLAVALLEDDYPPVTGLLVNGNAKPKEIAWEDVVDFNAGTRTINVSDLKSAKTVQEDGRDVLLKRDILDSLILDLLGRRTTRVCDLFLEMDDEKLRLRRADSGIAAMLRRVFHKRPRESDIEKMFDWKYVEFLRGDPSAVDNGAGYRLRINRLPAGEIARLADYIPYLHAAELLKLLPNEKAADVLEAMPIERQLQIVDELDEKEVIDILCLMSPDLAADIAGRLDVDRMRRYLQLMPQKRSHLIVELLRYPENSVGGVMTNEILVIAAETSCGSARKIIEHRLEEFHFTDIVFIVDDLHRRSLRGIVSLKEMLAAKEAEGLEEIMDPYLQTLDPFASAADAAYRIVSCQLSAMPVVDEKVNLLGAMTIEAAIAQLMPQASNLQRLRVFS